MAYNDVSASFAFPTGNVDATTTTNGIQDGRNWSFPSIQNVRFKKGTGALQINLITKLYQATLAATTVLHDLTTLLDEYGTAINFARVKGVLLLNFATTAGYTLKAGGAVSNPWAAPFADVSDKIIVPPGYLNGSTIVPGFVMIGAPDAAGLVTSGTSKVLQLDSGSNSVPYGMALFGADA